MAKVFNLALPRGSGMLTHTSKSLAFLFVSESPDASLALFITALLLYVPGRLSAIRPNSPALHVMACRRTSRRRSSCDRSH